MLKQLIELELLNNKIIARVRKSGKVGWYVYSGVGNEPRYKVSNETELERAIAKIKMERGQANE